jgi:ABC-2 type transport system ATP-binding protein
MTQSQPILQLASLSKRYGDFCAVDAIDLQVAGGEVLALLGPNGAGKTTTMRMLMGILQPSDGYARVHDLDCFSDRAAVKRYVGYLPDEPVFYDYLRGREILYFVGEMHGLTDEQIALRSETLCEQLDLTEAMEEYAANYSKGMKKKLAAICALLHQPDLLILDEPTNGLDPFATRAIHQLILDQVSQGRSAFFATHLLDQAQKLCTRAAILNRGRLAAVGRLDELRRHAASDSDLEEIFFAVTAEAAGKGPETSDADAPSPPE